MIDSILVNILLCQFSNCSLIKVVLILTEDMPGQGSKLKKSSGRLLAFGDQLEKYSRQMQIFSRQFV